MIQTNSVNTFTRGDTPDDQIYTFEDIEKYTYVLLDGNPAHVIDKGKHIHDAVNARHMLIEPLDEDREPVILHERLVNERLYKRRRLWVDWENRISPYATET